MVLQFYLLSPLNNFSRPAASKLWTEGKGGEVIRWQLSQASTSQTDLWTAVHLNDMSQHTPQRGFMVIVSYEPRYYKMSSESRKTVSRILTNPEACTVHSSGRQGLRTLPWAKACLWYITRMEMLKAHRRRSKS